MWRVIFTSCVRTEEWGQDSAFAEMRVISRYVTTGKGAAKTTLHTFHTLHSHELRAQRAKITPGMMQ